MLLIYFYSFMAILLINTEDKVLFFEILSLFYTIQLNDSIDLFVFYTHDLLYSIYHNFFKRLDLCSMPLDHHTDAILGYLLIFFNFPAFLNNIFFKCSLQNTQAIRSFYLTFGANPVKALLTLLMIFDKDVIIVMQ